jgi:hypothetical protein
METIEAQKLKPLPSIFTLVASAKKMNLDGCDVFDEFTDKELEEQYNGVGPDRFAKWIRDTLSYLLWDCLEGVAIHDMDYYKGGTLDEFHEANRRLKINTRKIARKKFKWYQIKRWKLYMVAPVLQRMTEKYGLEGWKMTG